MTTLRSKDAGTDTQWTRFSPPISKRHRRANTAIQCHSIAALFEAQGYDKHDNLITIAPQALYKHDFDRIRYLGGSLCSFRQVAITSAFIAKANELLRWCQIFNAPISASYLIK